MFVSLQFILSIRAPLEEQTGGLNNALVKKHNTKYIQEKPPDKKNDF